MITIEIPTVTITRQAITKNQELKSRKMKKTEITKNEKSSVHTKLIKSFCFIFLLLFFTSAFSNNQKVEVSCSENDAKIYANEKLVGIGKVIIIVKKNELMLVTIKKVGYLTDEFTIPYGNGVSPEKKYFRTLVKEEAQVNKEEVKAKPQNNSTPKSKEEKLAELKKLYEKELITKEEYDESARVLLPSPIHQTQTDYALGRVNKTNSKLFFYWNEPINEYEIAFTFKNIIENINCKSPQQVIDASVKNGNEEAANQGKIYDAIILGTSDRDMAITWKDKSKDNAIARVKKNEGKLVFIECEPLINYDIVGKYNISGVGQQILIGTCPGHQEKVDKLIKKAGKDKLDFDGVMYGSSKNDLAIKFK